MSADGLLSPEGSCKTFDATADGFARAEAVTAVYIKPLRDAIRDGNPIRAVIRGTATNSDGNSASLMSPNGEAHEELMRKVYAHAGLNPKDTAFVECHGTGMPTGDPIETTAVGKVFATDGHTIHIGSVKPNVGHSEGASGVTSLIKCVLALENKTIPPNIKFTTPNPKSELPYISRVAPTDVELTTHSSSI
jgi:acyl transferase domain-containing protein